MSTTPFDTFDAKATHEIFFRCLV
jgi:hypothetical protein